MSIIILYFPWIRNGNSERLNGSTGSKIVLGLIAKEVLLNLCIFPKIIYGVDFLTDKDYHVNNKRVHVHAARNN